MLRISSVKYSLLENLARVPLITPRSHEKTGFIGAIVFFSTKRKRSVANVALTLSQLDIADDDSFHVKSNHKIITLSCNTKLTCCR